MSLFKGSEFRFRIHGLVLMSAWSLGLVIHISEEFVVCGLGFIRIRVKGVGCRGWGVVFGV